MNTIRHPRAAVRLLAALGALAVTAAAFVTLTAQSPRVDPALYSGLTWRMIGPFRGGRVNAVSGVPGQPTTFYFGSVGGGVWKTTNAGRTWAPVFDSQPVGSIGAIGVAPSNPNVVYVGTGEADMRSQISYGNGVYKSTDGGRTWKHLGLDDTRQIGRVVVDPKNPDVVFVAALGHAYGPNPERGVFRSNDGGATWQKVLFQSDNVGAIDLAIDPQDPKIVYAALWNTRRPPWSIYPPSYGPGSGLYKSIDGGTTWKALTGGLAVRGGRPHRRGRGAAPSPRRVYAIVDAKQGGLYRSDDAGATWTMVSGDTRIWGRGWYFCKVVVDPRNADIVYVSNTSLYRSTDGGQDAGPPSRARRAATTTTSSGSIRTTRRAWCSGRDQGAVVSVDGAATWSSWYNQPIAQLYHVAADDRFPYWVTGAQQDSGVGRGHHAQPARRDRHARVAAALRRRRGRLHGARPAPSRDPLRRHGHALQRAHRRDDERLARARHARAGAPHVDACRSSSRRPTRACSTSPTSSSSRRPTAATAGRTISPDLTREDPGVPPTSTPPPPPTRRRAPGAASSTPSPRRRSRRASSGSAPTTATSS